VGAVVAVIAGEDTTVLSVGAVVAGEDTTVLTMGAVVAIVAGEDTTVLTVGAVVGAVLQPTIENIIPNINNNVDFLNMVFISSLLILINLDCGSFMRKLSFHLLIIIHSEYFISLYLNYLADTLTYDDCHLRYTMLFPAK
jgi:hypothetical protein